MASTIAIRMWLERGPIVTVYADTGHGMPTGVTQRPSLDAPESGVTFNQLVDRRVRQVEFFSASESITPHLVMDCGDVHPSTMSFTDPRNHALPADQNGRKWALHLSLAIDCLLGHRDTGDRDLPKVFWFQALIRSRKNDPNLDTTRIFHNGSVLLRELNFGSNPGTLHSELTVADLGARPIRHDGSVDGFGLPLLEPDHFSVADAAQVQSPEVEFGFLRPAGSQQLVMAFRRTYRFTGPAARLEFDLDHGGRHVVQQADILPAGLLFELRQSADRRHESRPGEKSLWELWIGNLAPRASTEVLCAAWNTHVARPHLAALRTVRDGNDMSFVPELGGGRTGGDVAWGFRLLYQVPCGQMHMAGLWQRRPGCFPVIVQRPAGPVGNGGDVVARFGNLISHDDAPLELPLSLQVEQHADAPPQWRWQPGEGWNGPLPAAPPRGTRFGFVLAPRPGAPNPAADATRVRIGGFDLGVARDPRWAAVPSGVTAPQPLQISAHVEAESEAETVVPNLRPRLQLAGRLRLHFAEPGAQDPLPDELRARRLAGLSADPQDREDEASIAAALKRNVAIVHRRSAGTPASTPSQLWLRVREITQENLSRGISLELGRYRTDGGAAGASGQDLTVVVDTHPLMVGQVAHPPLESFVGQDDLDGIIANWSESELEGSRWEIGGITEGFTLTLPPQGIGEAMEKGDAYDDIAEGKTVDYRFSPPAQFRLLSSYFEQRYMEAPWNLRRVLGFPGQRAPGAGLRSFRAELLYGMSVFVETDGFVRLAELGARLGAVVDVADPQPAGDLHVLGIAPAAAKLAYKAQRLSWARTAGAYNTRLGVLEPWHEGRREATSFDGKGVTYLLRQNTKPRESGYADLRHPIRGMAEPAAGDGATLPRLAGGARWGFESKNIYDAVTGRAVDRVSTSALLSRPYFSALGGWGYQKAGFDNNKTKIYADTAMGRTFHYSLERIGRIGACWNVAKHVIVYERTVVPSPQFAPNQPPHLGRPLLRKVQEYVEIIQPVREFPEFGGPILAPGCVLACEFKQIRIPVDSAWGRDIEDGWVIPLWNPDANPKIYPKPDIKLRLAGDPKGAAATIVTAFKNPQQVKFYTSTSKQTDDRTDLWPRVEFIDYVDERLPQPGPEQPLDGRDSDANIPDAQAVHAGFEPLTFDIEPSPLGANLVTGRADNAINAVLHNVTIMRAEPNRSAALASDPALGAIETATALRRDVEKAAADLFKGIAEPGTGTGLVTDAIRAELSARAARLKADLAAKAQQPSDALKSLFGSLPTTWPTSHAQLCQTLRGKIEAELTRKKVDLVSLLDLIRVELEGEVDNVLAAFGDTARRSAQLKAAAGGEFDKLRLAVRWLDAGLGVLRADVTATFEPIDALLTGVEGKLRFLRAELEAIDKTGQAFADDAIERIRASEIELRRKIADAREAVARAATGRLAEVGRSVGAELAKTQAGLSAKVVDLIAEITTAQQLSAAAIAKLQAIAAPVADAVTTARKLALTLGSTIDLLLAEAMGELASWSDYVDARQKELETAIDAAFALPGDLAVNLKREIAKFLGTTLVNKVETAESAASKRLFDDKLPSGKTRWETICETVVGQFDFLSDLGKLPQVLADAAKAVEDFIANSVNPTIDQARAAIEGALDGALGPARDVERQVRQGLKDLQKVPSLQNPSETLRLFRAFGEAPLVPNIQFNRDRIAYFFDDARQAVLMSPAAALVNRVGDDLKALGIRVPTRELLDRIVPADLQNFDIGKIFPDIGGMKLDKLFRNFKTPLEGNRNVKVTHGFDKVSNTAWVKALVDMALDREAEILSFGPLRVKLANGRFFAEADVSARIGSSPRKSMHGRVSGSWVVSLGGSQLVSFVNTNLTFDDSGQFKFDISPDRVELNPSLKFLADLVAKLGNPGEGFTLELTRDGVVPTGVRCNLDLPVPPVAAGAFAVSGLRLIASFFLEARPGGPGGVDFAIGVALALGRKIAPFTLTIAFLNGGGWLEARAVYRPNTGKISTQVTIGIVAGAGAEFAFGPVQGGVYIQFGIFVEFFANDASRANGMAVGIMLLLRGSATLFGWVSISVHLLLQATYAQDRSLVGYGTLCARVKICWCLTLSVQQSVRYVLQRGQGNSDSGAQAAERHQNMFE